MFSKSLLAVCLLVCLAGVVMGQTSRSMAGLGQYLAAQRGGSGGLGSLMGGGAGRGSMGMMPLMAASGAMGNDNLRRMLMFSMCSGGNMSPLCLMMLSQGFN